jgi:hypothetical protein
MFINKKLSVVICESDINMALKYINTHPKSITQSMPDTWGKQQVINWVNEVLPKKIEYGVTFEILSGIWSHVVFLGSDIRQYKTSEEKYQIKLSVRDCNTDINNLITLN